MIHHNLKQKHKQKPPDYSVIKTSLKSIILPSFPINALMDAVSRMHLLSSRVSLFLRSYILYQFHNNLPIPFIDHIFIKRIFSCNALKTKIGRPPAADTKLKDQSLELFYQNEFSKLLPPNSQISGLNLSHIISNFSAKKMVINFEKSIQDHFFHYLFRFVNQSFLVLLKCDDPRDKLFNQQVKTVKDALVSDQLTDNPKFNEYRRI